MTKAKLLKFEQPDPIAKAECAVDDLMAHLKGMTVRQLAELSRRLQLRLYRGGRWVYLKDGRVSSQLELPRIRPKPRARCPLA
jgi:hypothetical protein